jgi:hypothetical protein
MTTALQPISGNILSPFVDQENVPSQKQKKIKKRRKSVGPPPGVDPLDEAEDAGALRFELDNVLEDNQFLQEQVSELQEKLATSEAERTRLTTELAETKQALEEATRPRSRWSLDRLFGRASTSPRLAAPSPAPEKAVEKTPAKSPAQEKTPAKPPAEQEQAPDNCLSDSKMEVFFSPAPLASAEKPKAEEVPDTVKQEEPKEEAVELEEPPPPPPPPQEPEEAVEVTEAEVAPPPPPPASEESEEELVPLAKRRSRRKSIVSPVDIAKSRARVEKEKHLPDEVTSRSSSLGTVSSESTEEEGVGAEPAAAAEQPAPPPPTLAPSAVPSEERLAACVDETALLTVALGAAIANEQAAGQDGGDAWGGVSELLIKLSGLAQAQRGVKLGGKKKRVVRFAVHDLSAVAPPKVSRPGSEDEQERMVELLVDLMRTQHELLPPQEAAASTPSAERSCLTHLLASLTALSDASGLSRDMRAFCAFYASELNQWLSTGTPMLTRRLTELISSSLRLHMTAIFSEEEEEAEPDPTLALIHTRVRDHAAAAGITTLNLDEAERFAALVTYNLLTLHEGASLVAPSTPAHAALVACAASIEDNTALVELPAEDKATILEWAQAHAILMQVFGPREPLNKLMKVDVNKPHFSKLSSLASAVHELGLKDELYLAPLRDIAAMQKRLNAEAPLAKAAVDGLAVLGKSRSSKRQSRAKK